MASDKKFFTNGIDVVTGNYLTPPMTLEENAALARHPIDRTVAKLAASAGASTFGIQFDLDPLDLSKVGWAVIYHENESAAVKEALKPLVTHRAKTAGPLVKELTYRAGESRADFLRKFQVTAGTVRPARVPYYLLIVGGPKAIPFDFGYLLEIEYAVGRLKFDTPAEYARYGQSVIDYESGPAVNNYREAVFFAPRHSFDEATQLSHDHLVAPLLAGFDGQPGVAPRNGFSAKSILAVDATRDNLSGVFEGERRPSILFTASHGIGWKTPDPDQCKFQGALLCQDFQGMGNGVRRTDYLAAEDIPDTANVSGLINFHFACYGAGTPLLDRFNYDLGTAPPQISDEPFFSALPKRFLSHPKGGALACVGHVERVWGMSIESDGSEQVGPFDNFLGRIMKGEPIGRALRDFSERYATLTADLARILDPDGGNPNIDPEDLVLMWRERNDAESYVVIGDPAVRLRVPDLKV